MTKQMKSLQHYFDQASDRPLAFNEAQLRSLIAQHDGAPGQPSSIPTSASSSSRLLRLVGLGLVIAAIGPLALDRASTPPVVTNITSNGAAAEASIASQSSPGVQARSTQSRTAALEVPATASQPNVSQSNVSQPSASPSNVSPLNVSQSNVRQSNAPRSHGSDASMTARSIDRSVISPAEYLMPAASIDVVATATLDIESIEHGALGLRRIDDRTSYGYYLVADLPTVLAPNIRLSEEMLQSRGYQDSLLVQTIGRDGRSDLFMSRADFPLGIVTRMGSPIAHSWQVITDESGRLLEERISVADGDQLRYLSVLFQRGADGGAAQRLENVRGLDAIGQSLRLNTLLPIRVRLDEDSARGVFWCRPDAALIAQLPKRSIAQLRRELEKAASVVGTRDTVAIVRRGWALSVLETIDSIRPDGLRVDSDVNLVPQGMTGAEIFAGSRHNAGAVTRFEPMRNPASRTAQFALELREPRRVTVTLHDVDGRRVRTLAATEAYDQGSTMVYAQLDGIARGLYLVAIATDRREQVVHRLVVE